MNMNMNSLDKTHQQWVTQETMEMQGLYLQDYGNHMTKKKKKKKNLALILLSFIVPYD